MTKPVDLEKNGVRVERRDKIENPSKFNILYVDDEEVNLRIFKYAFKRDYNVFTALNGEEALTLVRNNTIHLIITDQQMPKMTGVELLKKVMPKNPNAIRMIMTGFSDVGALITAVNEVGIQKYLKKPWEKDVLKETLDLELARHVSMTNGAGKLEDSLEDTVSFLTDSLQKDEKDIQKWFPNSYLLRKTSGTEPNEIFWVGGKFGTNIFCKIGFPDGNSHVSVLLAGIYTLVADTMMSLKQDEMSARYLNKKIEQSIANTLYESYSGKVSWKDLSITVLLEHQATIELSANKPSGVMISNGRAIRLVDTIEHSKRDLSRLFLFSEELTRIGHKNTTFDQLIEQSSALSRNGHKPFIKNELDFSLSQRKVNTALTIFGLYF